MPLIVNKSLNFHKKIFVIINNNTKSHSVSSTSLVGSVIMLS